MNTGTNRQKGQTIIETALVIILLLMLVFGIAEIARAWWFKNQLGNAARVAVRVAVVTSPFAASNNATCPSLDPIVSAACGVITNGALLGTAQISVSTTGDPNNPQSGDVITLTVKGSFSSVVPGLSGILVGVPGFSGTSSLIPSGLVQLTAQSIMRHE